MGKPRDHFKKIRDTKATFHTKMDTIKDRNDMDLTEADLPNTKTTPAAGRMELVGEDQENH